LIYPPDSCCTVDFGFKDGIAQPAVTGFDSGNPGQTFVDPGIILVGESGDAKSSSRATWTKDGSFLAFRQLKQLVPEFNKFLLDNALPTANGTKLTQQEGADLLGARMVGRWKSVSILAAHASCELLINVLYG
jgi:deferrochelatase/peroxidase EfeB